MRLARYRHTGGTVSAGGLGLFILIFGGIGLLLALIAGGMVVYTQSWLGRTLAAEGRVTELARSFSGGSRTSGPMYHPIVSFTAQDGRKIEFRSGTGSNPSAFTIGEVVTVRYDPANPDSAAIDAFFSLWLMPLIFGFIGAIFILIAGGMAYASRRRT